MIKRCSWVNLANKKYIDYHDYEWGIKVHNDRKLFEMLLLECFQAGLSWECILNKREAFRFAFDNFDPVIISKYNDDKINELMNNVGIVRNRRKIEASILNAKIFLEIVLEFGSFDKYIWSFSGYKVVKNLDDIFRTTSELSDMISYDLKKRGMKFVGSTIIYSYLQAIGVIDDHERECYKY